ncbi:MULTISPECIES: rhodanese-like domain-containing protein [Anaeromyxobacter]|uniref:rhodanese-like domain-containing protein n=1 Tax=Anaeromyxobacter TaxID=161492 RepID=UPI001F5A2C04|nr:MULTISPECIES: rhodanese-like domain-containing protein [unclassified Anaeromyxobacter]
MRSSLIAVAAVLAALVLPGAAGAQVRTVGADEVRALVSGARKAVLVDSRSPEEYAEAHLPGAISIPAAWTKAYQGSLPKDRAAPIVFYCRGGG